MDLWANVSGADTASGTKLKELEPSNPLHAPLLEAREEIEQQVAETPQPTLEDEEALPPGYTKAKFYRAVCDGDLSVLQSLLDADSELAASLFDGYTPLVFAVAYNQYDAAELLLGTYGVDPDTPDQQKLEYSPLMWAVHLDNLRMVELLLQFQADPDFAPNASTKATAASMVSVTCPAVYEYFKNHNLLFNRSNQDAFVYEPKSFGLQTDNYEDDLAYQIQMLSIAANQTPEPFETYRPTSADSEDDEDLRRIPDFNYSKAVQGQYIKFTDSDIPSLLDYIFGLRLKSRSLQHDARVPAAVVFQLINYSHTKVGADDLTAFLLESFIARVRSVTNTKSGVMTAADSAPGAAQGDIVLLSYWLSVIQFLHLHLTRGGVYKLHQEFLQTLISVTQNLIATISFSIDVRLSDLALECILDYTSLVDVSSAMYEKDWNFRKMKRAPKSYDDILDMLYPPSEEELRLPSPVRYLQVLGALDYVLTIHMIHPLIRFQAYSQVFYLINADLFNRVISTSKYCSRAKAIQIRLNVSALEDWLRSHNAHIYKPDPLGGLSNLVGPSDSAYTHLVGLLDETDDPKDPHSLGFLYKSLYHVGRTQLNPLIELLQWLQVVTGLQDEETFINTMNELDDLNYYQIYKVTRKMYRYEVNEPKVPKVLIQKLKSILDEHGEAQVQRSKISFLSQSSFLSKELYLIINPSYVFGIALPNLSELIVSFGAGLGGVKKNHAKKFQPHLPIAIVDDVDEILTENRQNLNDTYTYDDDDNDGNEDTNDYNEQGGIQNFGSKGARKESFDRDNMLYKKIEPPLMAHPSFAHDEIEINPW
ncbi:hypothetical protein PUMCH_003142 [Australozyma saopauloensis]|uniref:Dilute domain-containing protein n=1 Tax=Australozyma saopauloensis TaxID=291208 RepID=A0AAX4HBF0_9ASCO|nr:hypothetical protein PUMCH_003142 [[Candida] saopauloensis]